MEKNTKRIGETRKNNQGIPMTICEYVNANKLKVKFEDGYVTDWMIYSQFKKGTIADPYFIDGKFFTKEEVSNLKTGEIRKNKYGQDVKITAFRDFRDMDVSISDGTELHGVSYKSFVSGSLARPELSEKIGEVVVTKNNGTQKLIAYNNCMDVTVEFDDGTIREHVRYDVFKDGRLSKNTWSSGNRENHVGEKTTNCQGLQAKIICYNNDNDIIVMFNNYVKVRTTYKKFKSGTFKDPNYDGRKCRNVMTHGECVDQRQGLISLNKYGNMMKIVNYKCFNDIDVLFENGTVVKGVSYQKFKRGSIKMPEALDNEYKVPSFACVYDDDDYDEPVSEVGTAEPEVEGIGEQRVEVEEPEIAGIEVSSTEVPEISEQPTVIEDTEVSATSEQEIVTHTDDVGLKPTCQNDTTLDSDVTTTTQEGTQQPVSSTVSEEEHSLANEAVEQESPLQPASKTVEPDTTEPTECLAGHLENTEKKLSYNKLTMLARKKHLGEVVYNTKNERMEIIEYNNNRNVTIRFDDGTIRTRVRYYNFVHGRVAKPKVEITLDKDANATTINRDATSDIKDNSIKNGENDSMSTKAEGVKTIEVKPKNKRAKRTGNSSNSKVTAEGTDLLTIAEGYRSSANLLRTGGDATAGTVVFLCRAAAVSYLKYITKSDAEDVRVLGKVARAQGIQVDARDMAWLNDFDLGEDAYLQEATSEDAKLAFSILNKISYKVSK